MALAVMWRTKQLQYSLLRSMMNRYKDFWQLTQDGLVYSAHALKLDLTADKRTRLMDAYMTLAAFPDVKPGLAQLKAMGLHLAVLSNGEPKMLQAATRSAGIADLLDAVISVDEIKVFKPNPRVYELASTHLKTPKANIGFISSNNWDVNGAGVAFRLKLPHKGFHREIGNFAGHHISPDGEVLTQEQWNARRNEWMPSASDYTFVQAMMQRRVVEPGKFANWIAPPRRGIHTKPIDFEYVRFN